jgi:hypothetical protein
MAVANIINHIVLVLDASLSMNTVSKQLTKVADNQIQYLAQRSKELDQETRITVYTFGTGGRGVKGPNIDCLIYDMDVLRVPSIANLYKTSGMTPLIDATLLALDDLAMTPEKYGEHSFLVYVLTDGAENASRHTSLELLNKIQRLPDHWTVATFVPNMTAVSEAKRFGFPAQNIAVWDATTAAGVSEAGERIRQTTDNFMVARASGVRGSRNLFSLETPSAVQITQSLTALPGTRYGLYEIAQAGRIDDFVTARTGLPYRRGQAYYQLSKREEIQPQKQIAIVGNHDDVYVGAAARQLLGLPNEHVKVAPNHHPDYGIFVQSTSDNRKLVPGTRLLVLA